MPIIFLGAKVIIACRDVSKGNSAVEDIHKKVPEANVIVKHVDLASLSSVRKFCDAILKQEPYIHILINNAGIFFFPLLHLMKILCLANDVIITYQIFNFYWNRCCSLIYGDSPQPPPPPYHFWHVVWYIFYR